MIKESDKANVYETLKTDAKKRTNTRRTIAKRAGTCPPNV
jgi:hypothetical protein